MGVIWSLVGRLLRLALVFLGTTLLVYLLTSAQGEGTSLWGDYLSFLGRAITLDLGVSDKYQPGRPVADIALTGFGLSLMLTLGALMVSFAISLALGLAAPRSAQPSASSLVILILSTTPVFVLGYLLRDLVNPLVALLAQEGYIESPRPYLLGLGAGPLQYTLAALVLGLGDGFLANLAATVRQEVASARGQEHMLVAEVNGLSVGRHLASTLLIPLSTQVAARVSLLLGGVIIVETLFSLNGAGRILWRAALMEDQDVVAAVVLLFSLLVVAVRWGNETVALMVDPRRR